MAGGGYTAGASATATANATPARPAPATTTRSWATATCTPALDDYSRLAYTEILADETRQSAVAFWTRAHAFFASRGITVTRVLTDNGSCYRSKLWKSTLTTAGIKPKRTRPYRPQTNGKVERFHRTLADEWAYAKAYSSEHARRAALPAWLHMYNHHRSHTALGGPPITRCTNLSEQYS